jgi:hypothetical protein
MKLSDLKAKALIRLLAESAEAEKPFNSASDSALTCAFTLSP